MRLKQISEPFIVGLKVTQLCFFFLNNFKYSTVPSKGPIRGSDEALEGRRGDFVEGKIAKPSPLKGLARV
jgi:hypothetical protein